MERYCTTTKNEHQPTISSPLRRSISSSDYLSTHTIPPSLSSLTCLFVLVCWFDPPSFPYFWYHQCTCYYLSHRYCLGHHDVHNTIPRLHPVTNGIQVTAGSLAYFMVSGASATITTSVTSRPMLLLLWGNGTTAIPVGYWSCCRYLEQHFTIFFLLLGIVFGYGLGDLDRFGPF